MRRFWLFRRSVVVGACLLCWVAGRAESRGLLELTGKMVASAAGGVPSAYVFYDLCQNLDRARAGRMISLTLRVDIMGDDVYDGAFWVHPRVETFGAKPSSQQIQRS